MGVLLANIGTSDFAVKIGKYFLPIGFDRNEPGLNDKGLTPEESKAWKERETLIAEKFCPKIKIIPQQSRSGNYFIPFREVTRKISKAYQNYQEDYQKIDRVICPIRIWGVIQKAYTEFGVKKGYIFVTNQQPEHPQDTIYLFKFLQLWLKHKIPDFQLIPIVIPPELNPTHIDPVLNFYYEFLIRLRQQLGENEEIFVSCKGGTPQMQNALTLQVTALAIPRLLFIDPDPCFLIKRTLNGEPPLCNLKSYWRYNRQQKYHTVQQLLNRWDFDGAINILNEWQKELTFLQSCQLMEMSAIEQSSQIVKQVIAMLKTAHSCWEFDLEAARKNLKACSSGSSTEQLSLLSDLIDPQKYDAILNLYTQIMIERQSNQVGNILTLLTSFYEMVCYRIIQLNGGTQYLDQDDKLKLSTFKQDIGEYFSQKWNNKLNQLSRNPIQTRQSMKNFIDLLLSLTNRQKENRSFQEIYEWKMEQIDISPIVLNRKKNKNKVKGLKGLLATLEYWIRQRNLLIHTASGFSVDRINELDEKRPSNACAYNEIPKILEMILQHPLLQLNKDYNAYKKEFISTDQYYIYSAVRTETIATLLSDLKTTVV